MITVTIHNQTEIPDELFKFAVIAARYDGKWIFSRHRQRTTWEIPGGHREAGEKIDDTARRELYEESGAEDFSLRRICAYSVTREVGATYGMLYFAEVKSLDAIPDYSEIGEIRLFDSLPDNLTYPDIQTRLMEAATEAVISRTESE